MIQITAECSNTIARFTIEEPNPVAPGVFKTILTGATLRDLAKLGIARCEVEHLKPTQRIKFQNITPATVWRALAKGALPKEEPFALVESETLSDQSIVYNVVVGAGEGKNFKIGALDELHANTIAKSINDGAGWIS